MTAFAMVFPTIDRPQLADSASSEPVGEMTLSTQKRHQSYPFRPLENAEPDAQ
jgi:hypothetical protein